jgi:DNA-binding MarR family transcriptional regulator
MVQDVVKELGYLTLGTRLKRLGERLQSQTQVLLEAAGSDLPASHFPILAALDRLGSLNVGDLTEAVGISQPGVTRLLEKLETGGLVQSSQSAGDRRVRSVELSKAGRQLISKSKRDAWPLIEAAVADACEGGAQSVLSALSALEGALEAAPLDLRARRLRASAGKSRASA